MVNSNVNALGVIFANTYDNLVPELVAERSMASIPFGGRYRLIDFTLSSMANAGIDTGGRGGRRREPGQRTDDPVLDRVITEFADWGLSTAESVVQSRAGFPDGLVIASGGLRSGVDVAIAMALGADATGIGVPLSRAAQVSRHAVEDRLRAITESLRIAMLLTGARDVAALQSATLLPRLPT